jgi:RNA polymerase sporulation-specific sigma factor
MPKASIEEMDRVAIKYKDLKEKAESGDKSDQLRFESYKNICAQKLKCLINNNTYKYRRFSNYYDLQQDAFEALLKALDSFKPEKGIFFSWWANRYIETKVKRRANAHSTIKIPMKKAQDMKPYKVSTMPTRVDLSPTPVDNAETSESSKHIHNALQELPQRQRLVISMRYGFNGIRERPVKAILDELSLTRPQYAKLLSEAEKKIKRYLMRVER